MNRAAGATSRTGSAKLTNDTAVIPPSVSAFFSNLWPPNWLGGLIPAKNPTYHASSMVPPNQQVRQRKPRKVRCRWQEESMQSLCRVLEPATAWSIVKPRRRHRVRQRARYRQRNGRDKRLPLTAPLEVASRDESAVRDVASQPPSPVPPLHDEPTEQPEIPERAEFQAGLLEAQLPVLERGVRIALRTLNNWAAELSPPTETEIVKEGVIWVLTENEDVYERRWGVLTVAGDVIMYRNFPPSRKSGELWQLGRPVEVCINTSCSLATQNTYFFVAPQVFRRGEFGLPDFVAQAQPQRIEVESQTRNRNIMVCIGFGSVIEEMEWLTGLAAAFEESATKLFRYDTAMQLLIRRTAQQQLQQARAFLAAHAVRELATKHFNGLVSTLGCGAACA